MARYRYLFHDLLTNRPLAELELKGVSYEHVLNDAGAFSGALNLASEQARKQDALTATVPGRTALYIDRDGLITWGGIIWKRRYSADTRSLSLEGASFESYLARRRITDTFAFPNTDQFLVTQTLINNMQSKRNGNIGIEVGTETSGRAADRYFFWYELKPVLETIQQGAAVINGFDFKIQVLRDNATQEIRKIWSMGYPNLGVSASNTPLMWEYPGNIQTYAWAEDAYSGCDQLYATGSNEGEALMVSTATSPIMLDAGWPLLEESTSYPDVTRWPTLDRHAGADLRSRLAPITIPSLTIYGDSEPKLGTYSIGDFARFRIKDDRFPKGIDLKYRIYGIKVNVDDAGTREKVELTVGVLQSG